MKYNELLSINEGIQHHTKNSIPLHESVYRFGSDSYFDLFKQAREQYNEGNLTDLDSFDEEILRDTQLGEWVKVVGVGSVPLDMIISEENHNIAEAEYQGKKVQLSKPKRGGSKKFYVYTKNKKGNVIKVSFGAKDGGGNLAVKLKDPKARASFAARHDCENKTDKTKAGYWSCRLPRYAKSLGLSGGGTWW
tara:strand:- start:107 stop:682 length:576 start_codon:yes stop_codon:yes gene_type:complete